LRMPAERLRVLDFCTRVRAAGPSSPVTRPSGRAPGPSAPAPRRWAINAEDAEFHVLWVRRVPRRRQRRTRGKRGIRIFPGSARSAISALIVRGPSCRRRRRIRGRQCTAHLIAVRAQPQG
jgi:hypothetical protein